MARKFHLYSLVLPADICPNKALKQLLYCQGFSPNATSNTSWRNTMPNEKHFKKKESLFKTANDLLILLYIFFFFHHSRKVLVLFSTNVTLLLHVTVKEYVTVLTM